MARYNDSQPYTPDYEDDCADCGEEFPRGELAWIGDDLVCAGCEDKREVTCAMLQAFGAITTTKNDERGS